MMIGKSIPRGVEWGTEIFSQTTDLNIPNRLLIIVNIWELFQRFGIDESFLQKSDHWSQENDHPSNYALYRQRW